MSMDQDEKDDALRRAFSELRREDAAEAASFASVVAREQGHAPSLVPRLGRALAAAALAASLVMAVVVRRPPTPPALVSIEPWTAPTDFLLRTPGGDVLDTVPRIVPRRSLLALDGAAAGFTPNRRSPSP